MVVGGHEKETRFWLMGPTQLPAREEPFSDSPCLAVVSKAGTPPNPGVPVCPHSRHGQQ